MQKSIVVSEVFLFYFSFRYGELCDNSTPHMNMLILCSGVLVCVCVCERFRNSWTTSPWQDNVSGIPKRCMNWQNADFWTEKVRRLVFRLVSYVGNIEELFDIQRTVYKATQLLGECQYYKIKKFQVQCYYCRLVIYSFVRSIFVRGYSYGGISCHGTKKLNRAK